MTSVRQASFASGELAPSLHARTDVPAYASGLATCRNMLPTPHGSLVNRPGMVYVGQPKYYATRCRLFPFIVSATESYLLEFGVNYIRYWSQGLQIAVDNVPVETVTTYSEGDVFHLSVAQSGLTLTICHPNHPPRELVYTSSTVWTLSGSTGISFARPSPYFRDGYPYVARPLPTTPADGTRPAREWGWKVSAVVQQTSTGIVFETAATSILYSVDFGVSPYVLTALPGALSVYLDKSVMLKWTKDPAAANYRPTDWNTYKIRCFRVYRGRGGIYGYVGETTTDGFVDSGEAPDLTLQPPEGTNPFTVYNYLDALSRTENPAQVCFFEQRRLFANSWASSVNYRPGTIWASATGEYYNFDQPYRPVPLMDDAFEVTLSAAVRQEIRAMVGLSRLLVFTDSAVWLVSGPGGDALTAAELNSAQVLTDVGIAPYPDPLTTDDAVLYVRARGTGVQALSYDGSKVGNADASLSAKHLLKDYTLWDWTFQREPYQTVWAARADGKLLSLAYTPGGETGWAWHDTNGTVENVCCVPEGDKDVVYLVVRRDSNSVRYIEKLAPRVGADALTGVFLDCALSITNIVPDDIIDGWPSDMQGNVVYAVADGAFLGPFDVEAIPADGPTTYGIRLPERATNVTAGFLYTCDLETLDVAEARTSQKLVREVTFELEASRGLYAGESFTDLHEWRQRTVADSYGAITPATTRATVRITGTWNKGGRAVLRQTDPLPLTVLAVTREVVPGGT